MKTSYLSLNRNKGFENLLNVAKHYHSKSISLSVTITGIIALLVLFVNVNAFAQAPASSINGPLVAHVNDGNVVVTSEIASVESNPSISYILIKNTSKASIISQGTYQYDSSTGTGKQSVIINAGSQPGSFTVKMLVKSQGGVAQASKSVTVINAPAH